MNKKIHIGIFGRANAGKSTLFNLLTGRDQAVVSPQAGTTTDPVRRAMHLAHYGPVVWIDTAGFDDPSPLGEQRLQKTMLAVAEADAALFVAAADQLDPTEKAFVQTHLEGQKPYLVVRKPFPNDLLTQIRAILPQNPFQTPDFFGGRIAAGDTVVLVCPIDASAPAGKLIMPQTAALRAALDLHATAVVVQPEELPEAVSKLTPRLVVTDSQAFDRLNIPENIELTSFSILLAEASGCFDAYKRGVAQLDRLSAGDRVLLVEHCTHETTCDDIARVKIPRLLGPSIQTKTVRGAEALNENLSDYALVVQCGGCVASNALVGTITNRALSEGAAVTNFGMLLKRLLTQPAKRGDL